MIATKVTIYRIQVKTSGLFASSFAILLLAICEKCFATLFVTFQAKTSTQQTYLPEKTPGFPREFTGTHRDLPGSLPGFTGKFTGMYRGKFPGIWLSLLWIHWEIPGSASELTEKAQDLPGYRDERCMTGEFSIPWEIFVLVFAGNVTFILLSCYRLQLIGLFLF